MGVQSRMSAAQGWTTTGTFRSGAFIHNCPYCRCQNHSPQSLYLLPFGQPVTDFARQATPHFVMTFPPRQNHFAFSYLSPTKLQRYHSAEGRFSTRRYKDKHFPYVGRISESESPIACVKTHPATGNKAKVEAAPLSPATREGGHDRAGKSAKRAEQSNKGNRPESQNCNGPCQNRASQSSSNFKATPIQYLKQLKKEQQRPKDGQLLNSEELVIKEARDYGKKRYPTVKYIDIFEQRDRWPEQAPFSQDYLSHREVGRGEEQGKWAVGGSGRDNELIGSSIAEELQLNYDYYTPLEQTDQSLSAGLSF